MKFRKKPVIIEAVQWRGGFQGYHEIKEFVGEELCPYILDPSKPDVIHIETLEGLMAAQKGDWIIKGIKNEFYPCREDIFYATYEKVEE